MLRWSDSPGLGAPCNARNASASPRNGLIQYFGSDAAQQALEAARAMLLVGGAPLDVLAAINRAGVAVCDPAQPSRGFMLWVGTPCYNSILESNLGTCNLSRLVRTSTSTMRSIAFSLA